MKKKNNFEYKFGQVITIIDRKCSDKVQPKVKVGDKYTVLEQHYLKSGAISLLVVNLAELANKAGETPIANIDPKLYQRINEERFVWSLLNEKKKQRELEKTRALLAERAEQKETEFLEQRFTQEERFQMSYRPYLFAELSWHFALKALSAAAAEKIEETKKISREVTTLRKNFLYDLNKNMSAPVVKCAQNKVSEALQTFSVDFLKLQVTINNELNRSYIGVKHDAVKTYALISSMCYYCQSKIEDKNTELIRSRLGGGAYNHESFGYMGELHNCMLKLIDGCKLQDTLAVITAIKVLEKNIMSLNL